MTYLPTGSSDVFFGADFVFNPAHPAPGGNIYTNWAALVTAAQVRTGLVRILIGDVTKGAAIVIPTGSWDLENGLGKRFILMGPPGLGIDVEIADGCDITGVVGIADLNIDDQSDSAVFDLTASSFFIAGKSSINVSGAGPMFSVTGATTVPFTLFGEARLETGTIFDVAAISSVDMVMHDKTFLGADIADGAAGASMTTDLASPAVVWNQAQAGWDGGAFPGPTYSSSPTKIDYAPGITGVNNVENMLDYVYEGTADGVKAVAEFPLADNTGAPTPTGFSFLKTNIGARLFYTIERATTFDAGMIAIVCDGTSAAMSILGTSANIGGATGVTLSVDVSGPVVRLLFVTTNTGNAATLSIKPDFILL